VLLPSLLVEQSRLSDSQTHVFRVELQSHSDLVTGFFRVPRIAQGQAIPTHKGGVLAVLFQLSFEELERSFGLPELHIGVSQAYHGNGVGRLHVQGLLKKVDGDTGLLTIDQINLTQAVE